MTPEETKQLQKELHEATQDFIRLVNKQKWDTELRTRAETIVILAQQFPGQPHETPSAKEEELRRKLAEATADAQLAESERFHLRQQLNARKDLTPAHALCEIRSEKIPYQCTVEYLVTGRATVKSRDKAYKYVYDGHTFDLVAVLSIHKDTGIEKVSKIFPPGTKSYVISLIGTEFEQRIGYQLTDIDERDLVIHEVSEPIYRNSGWEAKEEKRLTEEEVVTCVREWLRTSGALIRLPEQPPLPNLEQDLRNIIRKTIKP